MLTETAKHTRGPWVFAESNLKDFDDTLPILGQDISVVCDVWPMAEEFARDSPVSVANARLIAAAPELLEALTAAVAYLEDHRPTGKIRDIFSILNRYENDVMSPARAAIAKATT